MQLQKFVKKPVEIQAVQFTGGKQLGVEIVNWIYEGGGVASHTRTYTQPKYPAPLTVVANLVPALVPGDTGLETEVVPEHLTIKTLEGMMRADIGDWIIRGLAGEFYPCKPDIFKQSYEVAPTLDETA